MGFGALRTLALELTHDFAFGVDAIVQRQYPDVGDPIVTRGIWVTQITEMLPDASEFQRREPVKIMSLRRDVVATVPRGTTIQAPETPSGPVLGWKVDGTAQVDNDKTHVVLVRYPDLDANP